MTLPVYTYLKFLVVEVEVGQVEDGWVGAVVAHEFGQHLGVVGAQRTVGSPLTFVYVTARHEALQERHSCTNNNWRVIIKGCKANDPLIHQ